MKRLMTIALIAIGCAPLAAQQLPYRPMPPIGGSTPPQAMMGAPSYAPSASDLGQTSYGSCAGQCQPGCSGGRVGNSGSLLEKVGSWLAFRPCPRVHGCVAQPYRSPLRDFFPHSECGVGCANASDCGGCATGRGGCLRGGCAKDGMVSIPPPSRMCNGMSCGGQPSWGGGNGCSSCGKGLLGGFGLRGYSCGLGGCGNCQFRTTPMNDPAQYSGFTTVASVGRVNGLSQVGPGAAVHFANPYRSQTSDLQYGGASPVGTPGGRDEIQPQSQPMSTPNPFPGPQQNMSSNYRRP